MSWPQKERRRPEGECEWIGFSTRFVSLVTEGLCSDALLRIHGQIDSCVFPLETLFLNDQL